MIQHTPTTNENDHPRLASHLARRTLTAFVLTFLLARILVLLIMSRRVPDFFLHVRQTHVHHLNYGIFLLAALGHGSFLLRPPAVEAPGPRPSTESDWR